MPGINLSSAAFAAAVKQAAGQQALQGLLNAAKVKPNQTQANFLSAVNQAAGQQAQQGLLSAANKSWNTGFGSNNFVSAVNQAAAQQAQQSLLNAASKAWGGGTPPAPTSQPPGGAPTHVVTGTRDGFTPDRTQSDQYRAAMGQQAPTAPAFPLTQQGQFNRYFGTDEMNQYFGAASRGTGAPANLEAMQQLAAQKQAPLTSPLATYYRAQSAAGRGDMDEIVNAMGYKGTPMETWARNNPMLAFREYNKKFPVGQPTQGPSDQAIGQALKGGTFYPAEGSPAPLPGMAPTFMPGQPYTGPMSMPNSAIAGAGNVVPAPPGTQGTKPPIEDKVPIGFRVDKFLGRSTAPVGDFFVPTNPVG